MRMLSLFALAALVGLGGSAFGQDPAESSTSPTAEERHAAIEAEANAIVQKWFRARQAGESVPARPDLTEQVRACFAAADEYAGEDDAVRFYLLALRHGETSERRRAATRLIDEHTNSEELVEFGRMLGRYRRVLGDELVTTAVERLEIEGHPAVAQWAMFTKIEPIVSDEKVTNDSPEYQRARSILSLLEEKAHDDRLKRRANGILNDRERLQIDQIAPDIEGEDLDGVPFKLSDYRGKVVMLDFWGDW